MRVVHARNQRSKAFALDHLASGERKRAHGPAVKRSRKGDEFVAAGVIASQLHRGFGGFGSGVSEVHPMRPAARRDGGQLLRQLHHVLVIEIGARHVDQALGLLFDGLHHLGVAMAGGGDGDPGIEVEKSVPIDIFDHRAFPARGHQRITTRVGRRKNLAVARDQLGGAWARQRRQNMREVQTDHFFG